MSGAELDFERAVAINGWRWFQCTVIAPFTLLPFWIGMLLAGSGIGKDDNSTTLSNSIWPSGTRRTSPSLPNWSNPPWWSSKASTVWEERAVGEPALLSPRTVSLRPTFTSSANIETSPFALPTARLSAPKHLGRRPGTGSRLGQDRCKGFADPRTGRFKQNRSRTGDLLLGQPLGYSHSVSRGVVAAIRELEDGDGRPMVQVAIPIEPGSSGSPTLDLDGRVIAILAIKSGGAMGFGIPSNALQDLLNKQNPIPMKKWLTIGALDDLEWKSTMGGSWKQRAGVITASGLGSGFGGRMLCLSQMPVHEVPHELEVEVKLEDESGAAGLVFHGDGKDAHYGFYPTNGGPLDPIRRTERIFLDHPQNLGVGCLPSR